MQIRVKPRSRIVQYLLSPDPENWNLAETAIKSCITNRQQQLILDAREEISKIKVFLNKKYPHTEEKRFREVYNYFRFECLEESL
jgi:hypothetical protein